MRNDEMDPPESKRPPFRRTAKLSEVLAREIVLDMRDLPVGAKLPSEATMLERYQVGRASLREALRLLEVQGLIIIRPGPGGGPVVAGVNARHYARMSSLHFCLNASTYRELIKARLVIEPVMARLAAERRDPDDLERLRELVNVQPDPEGREYLPHSAGFHLLLSGISGNSVLDLIGRSLAMLYEDRLDGVLMASPLAVRLRSQEAHARVAEAIFAGDPELAEQRMREHMLDFVEIAEGLNPEAFAELITWQ